MKNIQINNSHHEKIYHENDNRMINLRRLPKGISKFWNAQGIPF